MMTEVKKTFAHLKNDKKSGKLKTIEKQNKPVAKIKHKATDQTHFVLAFRALNVFDKKSAIASVMSGVLGTGMSSRLFHKLREEMGVCYYVRANTDPYTDHGVFQISSGVDNKRVKEVISAILVECEKLKNELVPEKELAKVEKDLLQCSKKLDNRDFCAKAAADIIQKEEEKFKGFQERHAVLENALKKLKEINV